MKASESEFTAVESFIRVEGSGLVDARGDAFFIRGTNLGHWLNPEGYMFGFGGSCNSAHFIDEMFKQLVGPARTRAFWRAFKDSYVTEDDIAFIAATGANTVRLPFHYKLFTDFDRDPNMMYECHHYSFGNPVYDGGRVAEFAAFRDRCGKPMYMGETGHNTDDWCRAIREDMERSGIGWTFWPYKMPVRSAWCVFPYPEGWDEIVAFAKSDRSTYAAIQQNVPDRARARAALERYAENCRFANCRAEAGYLKALGLDVPA